MFTINLSSCIQNSSMDGMRVEDDDGDTLLADGDPLTGTDDNVNRSSLCR